MTAHRHPPQPLFRAAEVRTIEQRLMQRTGQDPARLMQRAGAAALQELLKRWPGARRLAVCCGPGNNGGDGFVLAALARAAGLQVEVFAEAAGSCSPAAAAARAGWTAPADAVVRPLAQALTAATPDLVVDALFGIGLKRPLQAPHDGVVGRINHAAVPVLALDVPSGIDADSGAAIGEAVRADCTVSFVVGKPGLYSGSGLEHAGVRVLAGLGCSDADCADVPPAARALHWPTQSPRLPPRPLGAHKGMFGHLLALGGDHGFGGAIRMCAEAALRCGAGKVSVATRAAHVAVILGARPECMVHGLEDGADLNPDLLAGASVIAVGPGLGRAAWGRRLLATALDCGRPLVVDADGLNLLAEAPRPLSDAVITPHPGEAARLLGRSAADIEADRYAAAAELVRRYRTVVVLKGAGSIVAAPERIPCVIEAGNPGMASGGMGDVLTGVIGALRAQQLDAFDAACLGALLHGAAGDAAVGDGQRGLLAMDLMPELRRLLADV